MSGERWPARPNAAQKSAAPVGAALLGKQSLSGDQDSTLYFLNQFTSSPQACLACVSR